MLCLNLITEYIFHTVHFFRGDVIKPIPTTSTAQHARRLKSVSVWTTKRVVTKMMTSKQRQSEEHLEKAWRSPHGHESHFGTNLDHLKPLQLCRDDFDSSSSPTLRITMVLRTAFGQLEQEPFFTTSLSSQ